MNTFVAFHSLRGFLGEKTVSGLLGRLLERRKTIKPIPSELVEEACNRVRLQLAESMPTLENSFLKIGEQLESMDACSRRLNGHCEQLLHLASGSEEGSALVRESLGVLQGPLAYIDFCMREHERLLRLLEQCEKQTRNMLSIRDRMHDAIAPLTFMAVLFKIESAYLPAELRDTFMTVTLEVERLHKIVDETFTQNALQLNQAYQILSSVRKSMEADFQSHATHVTAKRRHIDSAIMTLDEQLSQNSERDSRLHSHGSALSAEVGKVVMGLQFQDIVKQKCDHIVEALDGSASSRSAANITLQVGQLRSVEDDLNGGCTSVREGLQRISQLTEQLNHSSVSLESFENMTAAVDGMVQLLLDTMADVHEIIHMVSALTEKGHKAVQPANGIARNLTSAIGELSINMRLIALNAQIRSVQSGSGTGLEVLAARTAEISDQINEISTQVSDELAALHAAIDEMLATFSQFTERGRNEDERLQQARGSTEPQLHALRDRALSSVQAIGEDVEAMHGSVASIDSLLDQLPSICEQLHRTGSELEQVRPAEGSLDSGEASRLSSLASRYTMSSEREVHAALLAAVESAPKGNGASAPASANEGDMLFFDAAQDSPDKAPAPKQEQTKTPAATPPPAPANDNVELF